MTSNPLSTLLFVRANNYIKYIDEMQKLTCGAVKSQDDVEAEMRRLKLELKQTMEMYSSACREALTAKQKLQEIASSCHVALRTPQSVLR
jgi:hypothetical protein